MKLKPNIFENIDKNKSYILGFLWADGYIRNKKHLIETTIKTDDFNNINSIFRVNIKWNTSHRERKNKHSDKIYYSSCLSYYSKLTHDFLKSMDYHIKSQSQPTKILKYIPKNLHNHFYRGYIDGDGSFSYYMGSNNYMTCKFNITSTIQQEWSFIEMLFNSLKINHFKINKYIRKVGNFSIVGICNKWDIIKIGDYLYENSVDNRLERKYNKYLEIKNCDIVTQLLRWTEDDMIFLRENYKKYGARYCARILNKSENSIRSKIHYMKYSYLW